jgi:hypothetical protein
MVVMDGGLPGGGLLDRLVHLDRLDRLVHLDRREHRDHPDLQDRAVMARDLETVVILEVITLRTTQEIKGNNTKEGKSNCKLTR